MSGYDGSLALCDFSAGIIIEPARPAPMAYGEHQHFFQGLLSKVAATPLLLHCTSTVEVSVPA
jgi:hypothetical protein